MWKKPMTPTTLMDSMELKSWRHGVLWSMCAGDGETSSLHHHVALICDLSAQGDNP